MLPSKYGAPGLIFNGVPIQSRYIRQSIRPSPEIQRRRLLSFCNGSILPLASATRLPPSARWQLCREAGATTKTSHSLTVGAAVLSLGFAGTNRQLGPHLPALGVNLSRPCATNPITQRLFARSASLMLLWETKRTPSAKAIARS